MLLWTDLAPWEFEFPFPGSRVSTFLPPPTITLAISASKGRYTNRLAAPLQGYLARKKQQTPRTLQ